MLFCFGATRLSGRFTEGFSLRRLHDRGTLIVSLDRRSKKHRAAAAVRLQGLVRQPATASPRPGLRRIPDCPGAADAPCGLPSMRRGEAGAPGLSGRQSTLHGAVRHGRWARCRRASVRDVGRELDLDWHTVKTLDKQYMRAQLAAAGTPAPRVIGIDEISIRKGHTYRIVVSDLIAGGRSGSAARIARKRAWRSSMLAGAGKMRQDPARRDGHVEAVPQRHPAPRRRRRSCSTSSTSCAISARRSTRCARPSTPASPARTGASSRARSTLCCRATTTSPWRAGAHSRCCWPPTSGSTPPTC